MVMENNGGLIIGRNEITVISALMIVLLLMTIAVERPTDPPTWWVDEMTEKGQLPPALGGPNETKAPVRTNVDLGTFDGYTQEGETSDKDIKIGYDGGLELHIELTWSDDIGDNDEMGLAISNASGEIQSVSSKTGDASLSIDAGPDLVLSGDYMVSVQAIDCPGLIGPIPIDRDDGNSWSMSITLVVEE